jgi:hypothetical protein
MALGETIPRSYTMLLDEVMRDGFEMDVDQWENEGGAITPEPTTLTATTWPSYTTLKDTEFYTKNRTNPAYFDQIEAV